MQKLEDLPKVITNDIVDIHERTHYTKVLVVFNDGSIFEGNEFQVSIVSGFTANSRGGIKETHYIDGFMRGMGDD